jgi:hypothetical protein
MMLTEWPCIPGDETAYPIVAGPVLHADDAAASKMTALLRPGTGARLSRYRRDPASGRYSRERLLELAAAADDSFDRHVLVGAPRGRSPRSPTRTSPGTASPAGHHRREAPVRRMKRQPAHLVLVPAGTWVADLCGGQ